jgi:hypothetical protein
MALSAAANSGGRQCNVEPSPHRADNGLILSALGAQDEQKEPIRARRREDVLHLPRGTPSVVPGLRMINLAVESEWMTTSFHSPAEA